MVKKKSGNINFNRLMNEHLVLNIEMKWLGQETCEKYSG